MRMLILPVLRDGQHLAARQPLVSRPSELPEVSRIFAVEGEEEGDRCGSRAPAPSRKSAAMEFVAAGR